MISGRKKKKRLQEEKDMGSVPTLIGTDTVFEGAFKGKDSICIQGEFKGSLQSEGNVYINQQARVEAEIDAQYVAVHGEVHGNIVAQEELNIGPTGRISGDVQTKSLTVATGGYLDGCCRMDSSHQGLNLKKEALPLDAELTEEQKAPVPEAHPEDLQQSMQEFLQEEGSLAEEQESDDVQAKAG
ncbi:MAG: bactofilin family protein [Thermodesulfobacteriota bacterium]